MCMHRRILTDIVLLLTMLFLPWWVVFFVAMIGIFFFSWYVEAIIAVLVIDSLYGYNVQISFLGMSFSLILTVLMVCVYVALTQVKKELR